MKRDGLNPSQFAKSSMIRRLKDDRAIFLLIKHVATSVQYVPGIMRHHIFENSSRHISTKDPIVR